MKLLPWWRLIPTVFLFLLGSLVVLGLLALRYSKRLRAWLFYNYCEYPEATQVLIVGNDEVLEIEDVFTEPSGKKVFFYRKMKYCKGQSRYYPVGYSASRGGHLFNQSFYSRGLSTGECNAQQSEFGRCEHKVEVPSYFEYMGG